MLPSQPRADPSARGEQSSVNCKSFPRDLKYKFAGQYKNAGRHLLGLVRDVYAFILLARGPVIKCNTDYKTNQRFETTCFRAFHKSPMAQALPAIDNINVLIVLRKWEPWAGTHTHTQKCHGT